MAVFGLAHLLWSRFRIAIRLNSGKAVDLLCYLILVLMFTLELHQYGDERSRLLTRIESVHESLRYSFTGLFEFVECPLRICSVPTEFMPLLQLLSRGERVT